MKIQIFALLLVFSSTYQGGNLKNQPAFLNSIGLDTILAETNYAKVVNFVAPQCSDCKKTKPVFDAEKEKFQKLGKKIKFYEYNCQEKEDCETFQIPSFPEIMFFNEEGYPVGAINGYYPAETLSSLIEDYCNVALKGLQSKLPKTMMRRQPNPYKREDIGKQDLTKKQIFLRSDAKEDEEAGSFYKTLFLCILIGGVGLFYIKELMGVEIDGKIKLKSEGKKRKIEIRTPFDR